ncbi:polypeptide N-acetylgalactosaminyltransferase 5-like [Hydractinia symbiolongicarpus]|uniref:polypeptide N-acetylgalactosaminyltransferase 5-like n=1 Tax=Hydractinia symbiolongicarpus TaxID=13093 RepID=UPI0025513922|nr:polypeptide N-acetylgalactosaminyltransferase 5-like [Hydractinia symbiolongicarpus]
MGPKKRATHIWIPNSSKPQHKIGSTPKKFLLILVLTSLFWISLDILFLFYQQALMIDLDIVVINGRSIKNSETFTPPSPHLANFVPVPLAAGYMNNNWDPHSNALAEIYPELVIPALGTNGLPAKLPVHLKSLSASLFNKHSFDSVLSDRISLNRKLKDPRGDKCVKEHEKYPKDLSTTTVIICFHNEAVSVLLRTVHSVINRTPAHLLSEIILIDDASTTKTTRRMVTAHLHKINVNETKKIILIDNEQREGLVRSRLKGAKRATGAVLTFLDSHCEVTDGWIEPLLSRIKENKKNVVCPVIEVIDPEDFSYKGAKLEQINQVGGFTWDLFFNWKELPKEEKKKRKKGIEPLKSPTMAGGLFSIDRSYFYEIGSYDEQMDIWGSENLEMSFRIWMCGGRLEIIPCSRVGHIFRKENSPYTFPNGVSKTLAKNSNRLAEVWMDDYKELHYRRKSPEDRKVEIGDLTSRKALRKSLGCKTFKWYLDNIIPDMVGADPNPPAHGQLQNNFSSMCLDSMGKVESESKVKVFPCHGLGGNQFFVLSKRGEIVFKDEHCLDYSTGDEEKKVELWKCHGMKGNQEWRHNNKTSTIKHVFTNKCLIITEDDYLTVTDCNKEDRQQLWRFSNYQKKLW